MCFVPYLARFLSDGTSDDLVTCPDTGCVKIIESDTDDFVHCHFLIGIN